MSNESPQEVYLPSPDVVAAANVKSYEEMAHAADQDLEAFWAERAQGLPEGDLTTLEE